MGYRAPAGGIWHDLSSEAATESKDPDAAMRQDERKGSFQDRAGARAQGELPEATVIALEVSGVLRLRKRSAARSTYYAQDDNHTTWVRNGFVRKTNRCANSIATRPCKKRKDGAPTA